MYTGFTVGNEDAGFARDPMERHLREVDGKEEREALRCSLERLLEFENRTDIYSRWYGFKLLRATKSERKALEIMQVIWPMSHIFLYFRELWRWRWNPLCASAPQPVLLSTP